ncbi:hypothetical protein ACKWTF_009294 [Chironomus riparius]
MDFPPTFQQLTVNKSNVKAKEYQGLGNKSFENKKWIESLIFYNKSLSFACSKNILCLIYANRSAVYFEIQRYQKCLENINLARKNGYPKNKIDELNILEEKCKNLKIQEDLNKIQLNEKSSEIFKLSYPANEKIPWIVDCIEMKKTDKYGRGIYAKQDLKAGDIISIEDSVVCILRDDGYYKHCYNCMKTCMLSLIPCTRTASIMFCSTECMDKTYSKFGDMKIMLMDDVKLLSEIVALFDGQEKFTEYISSKNHNLANIFDYDLHNPKDKEYSRKIANCLLELSASNRHPVNVELYLIGNNLPKKAANRILNILFMNNTTHTFCDNGSNWHNDSASIPLFANIINHSCMPNSFPIFVDNKIVVCISEPIKAGDQIFVSYLNQEDPMRDVMKEIMFLHYNFKCDCLACTDEKHSSFWNASTEVNVNKNDLMNASYLNEGWNIINNESTALDEVNRQKAQNMLIMVLQAYKMTFPC